MIILLLLFFNANIKKKQIYETNSVNMHSLLILFYLDQVDVSDAK